MKHRFAISALLVLFFGALSVPGQEIRSPRVVSGGRLTTGRVEASVTALGDRKLLVTGGKTAAGVTALAELFDPSTGTARVVGRMKEPRCGHVSVLLADGNVLILGGENGDTALASAEIYDVNAGAFTPVGAMNSPRRNFAATLLADGNVLVTGGDDGTHTLGSAEVFDVASRTFSLLPQSMLVPRARHTATLLRDGRVFIAGGQQDEVALACTEYYDPARGRFVTGPDLSAGRYGHTATLLPSGLVAIIGGRSTQVMDRADIVIPPLNKVVSSANAMATPRFGHAAVVLPSNGNVMIIGGLSARHIPLQPISDDLLEPEDRIHPVKTVEIFDAEDLTFAAYTAAPRIGRPAAAAASDRVWSIGGLNSDGTAAASVDAIAYPTIHEVAGDETTVVESSGWQPGERVVIEAEVTGSDRRREIDATADEHGRVVADVGRAPNPDEGQLVVTATGATTKGKPHYRAVATGTLNSISPSTFPLGATSDLLTITGSDLVGNNGTTVIFTSSSGYRYYASPQTASNSQIVVTVPGAVLSAPGSYSVFVETSWYYRNCYYLPYTHCYWVNNQCCDSTHCWSCMHQVCYTDYEYYCDDPSYSYVDSNSSTITVVAPPPVVTVPPSAAGEATGPTGVAVTYSATATSAVDGTLTPTCDHPSGSTFALGATTVRCYAVDHLGNRGDAQFVVTVSDTTPPSVSVPANVAAEATSAAGAAVSFNAAASDIFEGSVAVTCTPASGSTFALGSTTVNCSATDSHGNTGSGHLSVTVVDTTAPALHLPADFAVEATGASGAVATFAATATDAVDGSIAVTCTPPSGSTFALGGNAVTCSATDAHGNKSSGTFTISITDATPPAVQGPTDITAEATGAAGAAVTFSASASDLVDGTVAVICSPVSGSLFSIATTAVSCSATDAHGNTGTATFDVTVRDTTAPSLQLPPNMTAEATGPNGAVASFSATANDLVDGSVAVLCAPASGSTFALGGTTVNCSATDVHGNKASGSFAVTVVDTTPPALHLPASASVEATGPGGVSPSFSATAVDLVDGSVAVVCSPASGSQLGFGSSTIDCTSTDAHGNSARGSFVLTVVDSTPPALHVPGDLVLEATSPGGAAATFSTSANDVVDGTVAVTCSASSGSIFVLGSTTVSCSATDAHGNTAKSAFSVTVQDTTPPALHLPADITVEATGANGAPASFTASAQDLVDGNVPFSCSTVSGAVFGLGTTTVSCGATDSHHNTSTGSFHVNVVDTTAPALHLPANIAADAQSAAGAVVNYSATATDIVDGLTAVSCSEASGFVFPLGTTTVTCSSTDHHSNPSTGAFTVTVADHTPPVISAVAATPSVLWPVNKAMIPVSIAVTAADLVDASLLNAIVSVTSNETITGGQGKRSDDWEITGPLTLALRADRLGNSADRVYTITVSSTDFSGNVSHGTVTVTVPHDQGR